MSGIVTAISVSATHTFSKSTSECIALVKGIRNHKGMGSKPKKLG